MKYFAIIVAGGSGKRMQNTIPKQFLLLNKKPVLMHTLEVFYQTTNTPDLILVLNANLHVYWKELCAQYNFNIPHLLVAGGEQRFHSVRNGLMAIKDDEAIVAIHDAVRPLVSQKLIEQSFKTAYNKDNAITYIKPSDSVRKTVDDKSEPINRDELIFIQTPQTFKLEQLKIAYQQHYKADFTDDATVIESAGFKLNLIEGEKYNIKITYPEDLELASFYLNKKMP
jgi:2-C-methyl-D-erythritol 4-phosphate cytidylyltransferase